jgi:peptidyl-prolyl cis-trans isomerase-like protein 2
VAAITESTDGSPPRADVFDLVNIVPYIRKYHTSESARTYDVTGIADVLNLVDPVTGAPLETTDLIKLNFHRVRFPVSAFRVEDSSCCHQNPEGSLADWVTYKPFSQHTHIVFLRNTVSSPRYKVTLKVTLAEFLL